MVAPGATPQPLAPAPLSPTVRRHGYGPVQFTVADALSMVQQGIIPEDSTVELLHGSLVYRDRFDLKGGEIVEGLGHNYVISALAELASRINNADRHLRTQSTLICSDKHAPIPDAVILRGPRTDYRDHLPTAADAYCVIEVADSSCERDAGEKLFGYAQAGIEQYIIINLRNRTAEVHTNPAPAAGTYPPPQIVKSDEVLGLRSGNGDHFDIPLLEFLP
jgi:hypothetical protein